MQGIISLAQYVVTGLFILEYNERINNFVSLEWMTYEALLEQKESQNGWQILKSTDLICLF